MSRVAALVAAGALGCSGATSDPGSDRDAYLRSASAPVPEARELCLGIRDPSLLGECVGHVVARAVAGGDVEGARGWCDDVPEGVWRDECWFRFIESQGTGDARLLVSCERAGRFLDSCVDHLFHLAVRDADLPTEVGREQEVEAGVERLVQRYYRGMVGPPREERVDRGIAMRLAPRWERIFDAAGCGTAGEVRCMYGYMEAIREATRQTDLRQVCADEPVSAARVREVGVMAWDEADEASERLAQQTWRAVCSGDWRPRAFGEANQRERPGGGRAGLGREGPR